MIIAVPRYKLGIDVGDEGFLAYGAERVLDGQIPNRDFVSLQPPLSFYTTAFYFRIFVTSLASLRSLGLSIYLLIITTVYIISLRFSRPILALTAGVLAAVMSMSFFNFTPFAVWHGILASLVALLLVLRFAETNRRRWAFLAGITTALIILSRHDQGFYFIIAVLIYALLIKFYNKDIGAGRLLCFWMFGILAVMIPLLTYWLVCGALPDMYRQLIIFPLYNYSRTSSLPYPVFKPDLPLKKNMVTVLFYLLPAVEFLASIWLIKKIIVRQFSACHTHAAFILVISILFFSQVLTRSDFHHLFIMLPVFFILFVLSIEAFVKIFSKKRTSAVVIFVILLLISSFVLYTRPIYLPSIIEKTTEISVERARGIRAYKAGIAKKIEMVTGEIQKYSRPGDTVLCLPYQPIFYFLSQRHNPTRWNYIWPGDLTAEDYEQMIKQADESRPAVVMLYRKDEISKYAPEIVEYVNKKYEVAEEFDFISIYVPLNP